MTILVTDHQEMSPTFLVTNVMLTNAMLGMIYQKMTQLVTAYLVMTKLVTAYQIMTKLVTDYQVMTKLVTDIECLQVQ